MARSRARTPDDLHDFIARLRAAGELHEVAAEVDPDLEITEITDRVVKEDGPALLFTNVRGHDMPVLTNQFGSDRRLAMAFGVEAIDDVADRIRELLELAKPPKGPRAAARALKLGGGALRATRPRRVRASRAPVQEVVQVGDHVDLDELPILTCWPEDGGRYVTLPLVFSRALDGTRNVGMYRVQQFDKRTCGMHWQLHKDAAADWRHMPPGGRLEVAVVIGSDPIVTYSATSPLPKDIDELAFAGFARGRGVELVKCRTVDLEVPASAEIVLEGYVEQGELRTEGPFGDHTGYYSLADEYPVLHVTAVTRRRDPVYAATIVGLPQHEDKWLGRATERIFLPLLQMVQHDIVDYDLPVEGVFHNCAIVSIDKQFPGHAGKAMSAIWGTALLSLTKTVIVVDADVDVHDYAAVTAAVAERWEPARDSVEIRGPIDVLDHAPTLMGIGGKLGIDATRPWASEGREALDADPVDRAAVTAAAHEAGASDISLDAPGADGRLAVVGVEKERPGQAREVLEALCAHEAARGLRMVLALDAADLPGDADGGPRWGHVAFRGFGNVDPARDSVRPDEPGRPWGIDATRKLAAEGYVRDWPSDIVMSEAIKQRVDERWAEYGIPTPGARTWPEQGLAEGERRIGPDDRARGAGSAGNAEMSREATGSTLEQ